MSFPPRIETSGLPFILKQPLVFIKNDSSEVMPAGGLGRVTGYGSHGGEQYWTVDKPNTDFHRWYIVNGPLPIAAGAAGAGHIGPIAQVAYDTNEGTPGIEESWGAKSGQWTLVKDRPGFTIIGVRDLADDDLVECIQQSVNMITGKADATITAGSSGTVSIHFAASASASEYDVTGNLKWMHNSEDISLGKQVKMDWIDGRWLITGAECE